MAVNFVKFQRGTFDAYSALVARNAVDLDTIYFIYDKNNPSNGGDLYLGYTLISSNAGGSGSGVNALSDLTDVNISNVQNFNILQYRSAQGKWVNKTLADVLADANIEFNPNITIESTIPAGNTVADVLDTISDKKEGDIAIVEGSPYIYDSTEGWVSLTNSNALERISTLENTVANLQTTIQTIRGEIDTKIAQANHLTYQVLASGETLSDIDTTDSNINKTVFLVPKATPENNNSYDEYMYVGNQFEKIGNWEANLNNYVTLTNFNTTVTNIQDQLDALSNTFISTSKYDNEVGSINTLRTVTEDNTSTIAGELANLYERLQWTELEEE